MAPFLTPWRWAAALLLIGLVAVPLLLPIVEMSRHGLGTWSTTDSWRLLQLLANTLLLVGGTLALTLPVGIAFALALFRTEFPGRRFLLGATFVMLFVPLPMIASAWQAFFGSDGWLPLTWWGPNAGRPWTSGMGPAIWVHFLAGLPWVIVIVGIGTTWVERELEEEALLIGPPWWVIWRFTLPRCRGAIVFAAVWLALQTAGEIAVADMMRVSTFAENVQIQFTEGDRGAVARSVTEALPLLLMTWILLMWYVPRLARDVPPLQLRLAEPCRFGLGAARWPDALGVLATLAVLFGVPLFSLVWKLGQSGHPSTWSARHAWHQLLNEARVDGDVVCQSVAVAVVSGSLVSGFALVLCWLAEESPWLSRLLIGVIAFAWAVPGPIVGIGEKDAIDWLVRWFPDGWVANALYHGPSPLPLAWAYMVRFTPFAAAILLPVVRLVPREPREAARLEGQGPWREFWTIVWPLTRRAVLLCAMLVAALSLGEVAASTRVETPGWESFAKLLFDRMHYGVDNNVAALSVLLLGAIVSVAIVAALIWRGFFGSKREAPDRVANTRI